MINHFLITRFNLKKSDWKIDINNQKILDTVWLNKRIKIFNKYCLPSVISQKTINFQWLIFFEEGTQKDVITVTENFTKHPFIESIFINGYSNFQNNLPQYIMDRLKFPNGKIITTRLDNDDAIHENFISEIQKACLATSSAKTLIHFPIGLFFDLTGSPKIARHYYPLNQFISLVEMPTLEEAPITVYSQEHYKWKPEFVIKEVVINDLWLQIIHGTNKENTFSGKLIKKDVLYSFNIQTPIFNKFYNISVFIDKLIFRIKEYPGKYLLKEFIKRISY